jgi:hypothetical protein
VRLNIRCIDCDRSFRVERRIWQPERVDVICPWCELSQYVDVDAALLERSRVRVAA